MISLLAGIALVQARAAPEMIVLPDSEANGVCLQAVIRLPALQSQELGAAYVYAATLLDGTEKYSRRQLIQYGSLSGDPPKVTLMPDHIRIAMSFPSDQSDVGISMFASLLKEPSLTEESVNQALATLPGTKRGLWEEALWPSEPDYGRLRQAGVVEFVHRYVRPENLSLIVSGNWSAESPASKLATRMEGWSPPKPKLMPLQTGLPRSVASHQGKVSTYELALPPISPTDAALETKVLTLYALGCGKGASVFRILRAERAWSYRQEAFLWPTHEAFQPRILWASTLPREELSWQSARDALIADVKSWTEADLARAWGAAEGSLKNAIGASPFFFSASGPLSRGERDQAYLAGFWKAKTKRDWEPDKLLEHMRQVRLQDLKEAATAMLEPAFPRVIPGNLAVARRS